MRATTETVRWLRDARVPFDGKTLLAQVGETAALPPAVASRLRKLGLACPVDGEVLPGATPAPVPAPPPVPAAPSGRQDVRPVRLRARWPSGARQSYELPLGAAAAFAGQLRGLGVRIAWHSVERTKPTVRECRLAGRAARHSVMSST